MEQNFKVEFEFSAEAPTKEIDGRYRRLMTIHTKAPFVAYCYFLDDEIPDETNFRLSELELKHAMIEAIMRGRFKIHRNDKEG
jgi:hypothetical protein